MPDEMTVHRVERPDCGHMQEIWSRKAFNIADYNTRLVPELQEKLKTEPCTECEKLKAEQEQPPEGTAKTPEVIPPAGTQGKGKA